MSGLSWELPTSHCFNRNPRTRLSVQLNDGSMVGTFSGGDVASGAVLETSQENGHRGPFIDWERPMPTTPSTLRAHFFGHFEMFCDDEAVALRLPPKGKALAILKYLLAHRTRPVSQDHLMGWLWPESSLKKARWSLNSAIHALRKLLSSHMSVAPLNCLLFKEGYYIVCPTARIESDVDEFDAHYERGRRLEAARRMEEATAEYERAVELYRGDYLIEDLHEHWTMVERERLTDAYMEMLKLLSIHYMEAGQPHKSIRASYQLLEKDRCHEDSYRLLMRCNVQLGLRGRALRHYKLCDQILAQEYSITPSSETQTLRERILLGDSL
jgi:LuxR family transcriptional regulator, maltose regulon positive regulatory protein